MFHRSCIKKSNPGSCALEYESVMQIVKNILIGYNPKNARFKNGIFGKSQAYSDACEEQS